MSKLNLLMFLLKKIYLQKLYWKIHKPIYEYIIEKDNFNNPNLFTLVFDFFCFYISKLIEKPFLNRQFVLKSSVFPIMIIFQLWVFSKSFKF